MKYLKLAVFTALSLCILLCIEALLLMLTTGTVVNTFAMPIFNNLDFLWLLLKNNPWNGFLELISQPVFILGHAQATAGDYLVALYYYPISSLLHLGLAWLITTCFLNCRAQLVRPLFITGSILLLVSINYVWLAGCCGAAPGWTLDTILLNYMLSAQGYPVTRMELYETIYGWMQPVQLVVMALAGILLWRGSSLQSS
jgi:hypothetical protein